MAGPLIGPSPWAIRNLPASQDTSSTQGIAGAVESPSGPAAPLQFADGFDYATAPGAIRPKFADPQYVPWPPVHLDPSSLFPGGGRIGNIGPEFPVAEPVADSLPSDAVAQALDAVKHRQPA